VAWIFLGLLLGQINQGNVFACLITEELSEVPTTLSEILKAAIPVIECSGIIMNNKLVSAVKEFMAPSYVAASNESGIPIPKWMSMLLNAVVFTGLFQYRTIEQIASKNFTMIGKDCKELDTFAIFDTASSGEEFLKLANKFLPNYRGVKLIQNYPFNNQHYLVVERKIISRNHSKWS